MVLIHRHFKVKIRSSLLFVMLSLLCSFPPTVIILYGSGKGKQRNKEEAQTFLVPEVEGDIPSAYPGALGQDSSLPGHKSTPKKAVGDLS